ncbi:hypothetical protein [Bradyrhizobium sp. HKCCYLS20291]|uniref:hypothetical protein n=1 Tax=Bradyrhizobium sp. HKCCYLS20291 TaxID=3420766 RepID=UPI003EBC02AC
MDLRRKKKYAHYCIEDCSTLLSLAKTFEEGKPVAVTPISSTEFHADSGDRTRIAFVRDTAGKVSGAILNPGPLETAERGSTRAMTPCPPLTYHDILEVDRRPWQPRQLAGEYGCSEHGEEGCEVEDLPVEGVLDTASDAVRSGEAPDDPVNADRPAADAAFKPKCLRISSSINASPTHAERCPRIQSEHVPAAQARGIARLPTR